MFTTAQTLDGSSCMLRVAGVEMTDTTLRNAGLRQMLSERRRETQDASKAASATAAPTDRLRCVTTANIPTPAFREIASAAVRCPLQGV